MHKLGTRINPRQGVPLHPAKALRRKAMALIGAHPAPAAQPLGPEATQQLLHELHMHQLELELQNLELRRAQEELEASRKRYADLYDLAPVGYLTLSRVGLILDANLTVANLLGVSRREMHRQSLAHFVLPEDQDIYYRHRSRWSEGGAANGCELRLLRRDAPAFWVRLEGAGGGAGTGAYRLVVSDIAQWRGRESPEATPAAGPAAGVAREIDALLAVILNEARALQESAGPASTEGRRYQTIEAACVRGLEVLVIRPEAGP